ncbi:hypothetical protein ALP65_04329, partial [Pseudomonas aeruginosa]
MFPADINSWRKGLSRPWKIPRLDGHPWTHRNKGCPDHAPIAPHRRAAGRRPAAGPARPAGPGRRRQTPAHRHHPASLLQLREQHRRRQGRGGAADPRRFQPACLRAARRGHQAHRHARRGGAQRRRPRRFRRAHDRLQRKARHPGDRGERQGAAAGRHRHGRARRRQGGQPAYLPVHQRLDHPGQHHRPRTGQARPGQRQGLHPQRPGLRQAPAGPARRRPGAAEQGPGRRLPRRHHPRRLRLPAARIRPGSHRRGRAGPRHRAESEPVEEDHRPAQGAGREGDLLRDRLPLHLRRDHPARVRGEALFAVAHFLWRLQRRQVRGRNGAQPRHRGPRHPGVRRMTVAERLCATPCGPAIEFAGIDLSLGGSRILDGVRLRVEAGSVHALVGPNGGGKSSLVKTLLGQMPHRGELRLEWPGAPGCIGYVPQALEFDRGLPLTVDDFMAAMCQRRPAFLGLSRSRRPAIDAALERVGMLAKRGRRMGALSGGERQRVLLAQGLVPPPQLLVLDEPMSALDEGGIQVFERLLLDWRQAGVTVLWIEH